MSKTLFQEGLDNWVRRYTGEYSTELELELADNDWNIAYVQDKWKVANDGSLRGIGYELSTKRVSTKKQLKDNVEATLKNGGLRILKSPRTSTHFHMNVQDLTHEEAVKILLTYYLLEHVVVNYCGDLRKDNLFCLTLSDAEGCLDIARSFIDKDWNRLKGDYRKGKYACLNIVNVAHFGTFELRCFPGTETSEQFNFYLDVFDCFKRAKDKFESVDQILREFTDDRFRFARKVFGLGIYGVLTAGTDQPALFELMDRNYSLVYSLAQWWNTRSTRVNKKQKLQPKYWFKSEQELDIEEHF